MVSNPKIARDAGFCPAQKISDAQKLLRTDLQSTTSYAVTLNGQMAGLLSLYATVGPGGAPNDSCLELAYMMLPNHQGQGYMTRALCMLIHDLKTNSSVKRLIALVNKRNRASQKVLIHNRFHNYRSVMDMLSGSEDLVYQREIA